MEKYSLESKQKMAEVIKMLISKKVEIQVRLQAKETHYTSSLIHFSSPTGDDLTSSGPIGKAELIMQKLTPAEGNTLIQSSNDIVVECVFSARSLRFNTRYVGISSRDPYYGIIVAFPESMEIENIRKEERFFFAVPDFISAEFTVGKSSKKEEEYQLGVIDCSAHGMGLLVTKKDMDLTKILKPGDRIKGVTCYAARTMITVDVVVRHITKIKEGRYKGNYTIGIESSEIIESCRPPWD